MSIHNDLIEAYTGFYEDEFIGDHALNTPEKIREWVEAKIKGDRPKERLRVYLEWNGILGYHGRIWEISQGGEFQS